MGCRHIYCIFYNFYFIFFFHLEFTIDLGYINGMKNRYDYFQFFCRVEVSQNGLSRCFERMLIWL